MHVTTATRSIAEPGDLTRTSDRLRLGAATVVATVLVAIGAHVSIALPFTPVPIVLSDFAVILVSMLLGPVAGSLAMLAYLAEGAAGMPVFSPHGPGGLAQLLGPTGGYLMSYPLAAVVAGAIYRHLRRIVTPTLAAIAAGVAATIPVFIVGAGWLAILLHLSTARALQLAVTPFLPGACVKVLVAAGILGSLNLLSKKERLRP